MLLFIIVLAYCIYISISLCDFMYNAQRVKVGDYSLINSQTGLHEVPTKLYFKGGAREDLSPYLRSILQFVWSKEGLF